MVDLSVECGRNLRVAGIDCNYLEAGTGEAVFLIHGSGPGVSAFANWHATLPALGHHFRVLAPDMVGFGRSGFPADNRYSLDLWVDQLTGMMDVLGIERAHLVGNSFGGAVSIAFASRRPDRINRLVLMGSAGLQQEVSATVQAGWTYQPSLDNMRATLERLAFDPSIVTDDMVAFRHAASIQPGRQEAFSTIFAPPVQRAMNAIATPDDAIRQLTCETLVIHGTEDKAIPVAVGLRLFELLPNAELHLFSRCGHWAQLEQAGRFNAIVRDFLAAST